MAKLPQARITDILLQKSGNDLLIYDLGNHKAYCLNETSAFIWQNCDGQTTFDDLKRKATGLTDELILLALNDFQNQKLLKDKIETGLLNNPISRREAALKYGSLAIALPVIIMLVAPTAISAQSACIQDNITFAINSTDTNDCFTPANTNRCCSNAVRQATFNGVSTVTCTCGIMIIG